jgi:hypothetical protein
MVMKYLPSLYSNHQARGDFLLGNSLFIGFTNIVLFMIQVFSSRDARPNVIGSISLTVGTLRAASVSHGFLLFCRTVSHCLSDAARSVPTVGCVFTVLLMSRTSESD